MSSVSFYLSISVLWCGRVPQGKALLDSLLRNLFWMKMAMQQMNYELQVRNTVEKIRISHRNIEFTPPTYCSAVDCSSIVLRTFLGQLARESVQRRITLISNSQLCSAWFCYVIIEKYISVVLCRTCSSWTLKCLFWISHGLRLSFKFPYVMGT